MTLKLIRTTTFTVTRMTVRKYLADPDGGYGFMLNKYDVGSYDIEWLHYQHPRKIIYRIDDEDETNHWVSEVLWGQNR